MKWRTNFYDFRFKSTATAGIGIHPIKAWLSQLVNFKNVIWTWGHFHHHHHHHHHHHVGPLARISLTLSRHFSLSFIASGRSSGLYPVSSHSCCMYVRAGRPSLARPYMWVYRSTSLMRSSQPPPPAVSWVPSSSNLDSFCDGGRWLYSWWFVGWCRRDLFNITRSILV